MTEKKDLEVKHISDIVGEWGKWQRNLTIFVFIFTSISAYNDMGYSFHSYDVNYWCSDVPIEYQNGTDYQCLKFTNANESCDHWEFDTNDFDRTINIQFELVCNRSNFASLTQSFFMLGFLVCGLVLSQFADKYGRKPLVWVSFILIVLSLISCVLSTDVIQYSISRFLLGLSIYGGSGTMCTSLLESCGPKHRSDIYMISGFGWVLGYVLVPFAAYWLKDYRYMHCFSAVPVIILIVWFYFIPESPRWLISNGDINKAETTLRKILKQNELSDEDFDRKFMELKTHLIKTNEPSEKTYTVLDLLKTSNLRKYTLIFWFSWIVIGLVYYGFSLNMSDFGGNFYLTFLLSGVVELPSSLISILALRYIARRKALIIFLMTLAFSSLAIIPATDSTLKITFALIGKFAVGSLWWILEVFVPEVYPTVLRNTGAGSSSSFSRLGSMASPFMKNLKANTSLTFVMILYAILTTIASVLCVFLPETRGTEIPDTLEEVENQDKSLDKIKNKI